MNWRAGPGAPLELMPVNLVKSHLNAATLTLLLSLAGCNQTDAIDPLRGGGGLVGNWAPTEGNYQARFDNGRFLTTALDTGNTISEGSYIVRSEQSVELNWTSNITQKANTAQCSRSDPNVLECTDQEGKPFQLRRIPS